MDSLGKRELIEFYNLHIKRFGHSPEALRWTEDGQSARYQAITELLKKINPGTLLDFGCGFGDLYEHLKMKGFKINYTGIDINEAVIKRAQERFPDARFICTDIEEDEIPERFDAVVACGVFNLRVAGIDESFKGSLKKLYNLTDRVLIVDLLTGHQKTRDVQLNLVEPGEFLDFVIKELSSNVMIIHQYVEGAFLTLIFRGRKPMENVI